MRKPSIPVRQASARSSILSFLPPALAAIIGGSMLLAAAWSWYLRFELRTGFDKSSDVRLALPIPGVTVYLGFAILIGLLLRLRARHAGTGDLPANGGHRLLWVAGLGGLLGALPLYLLPHRLAPDSALMGLLWHVWLPVVMLFFVSVIAFAVAGCIRTVRDNGNARGNIRRLALIFFVLIHIPSLWFAKPWETFFYRQRHLGGDEPRYLLLTHSLAQDRDFNIYNNMVENHRDRYICWTNPYQNPGDAFYAERAVKQGAGEPHSTAEYWRQRRYGIERIGMPLLLAPAYKVGLKLFARHRYAVVLMLNLILAFSMVNIYLLSWRITRDRRAALLAAVAGGLSGPMLFYGVSAYTEPVSAALLVFCLRRLHECAYPDEGEPSPGWFRHLTLALAIAYLPWVHEKMLMFSGVLLVMYAVLARPPRRLLPGVLAILALSAILQARYYWMLYGQFTPPPVHGLPFRFSKLLQEGFWGLFLDQKRGILPTAPWAFAGLAGLAVWVRRNPRFALWPILLGAAFLIGTGSFGGWYGGTSAQPRYPVNIMPVMAVGVAVAWTALRTRPARALMLATTAAGIIQGITAVLMPSFLAEHRAPFWRDLYPIVFRLDAIEVAVIAGWVLLLAWGWLALANGKRARQAIALPVACSALIIVGAGHRFLKNARPDIAAWNAPVVASFIEDDPRFATFNKRILMRRHYRALSAFPIISASVSTRIEAEVLDKERARADTDGSAGGVVRWTAPAAMATEGYRHVIQSPFMSLYEGHYRAVWRIRTGAEGSYPETVKAEAAAGDDVFNQIEIPLEMTRDRTRIELPFDLETATRGVVIRLLADGTGTLDVDFLQLEHTEPAP